MASIKLDPDTLVYLKPVIKAANGTAVTNFGAVEITLAELSKLLVAQKPQIAALTPASTAAQIVAALQA